MRQKTRFKLRRFDSFVKLIPVILPKSFQMKNYPIHENLDTSFVNLSALVKYLRRQRFSGSVRIEFGDYQAEIVIAEKAENFTVREHDLVSGRVGEGEEALQRLLIRARQSGGIISVFRHLAENPADLSDNGNAGEEAGYSAAPSPNFSTVAGNGVERADAPVLPKPADPAANTPEFPFRLSNNVENRARQNTLTSGDWQMLLDVTGELLGTIDETLAAENLSFKVAFQKASAEIADDYPFLHPGKGIINYAQGKITMREEVNPMVFVGGIMEVLRRIMEKLGANAKFAEIYRQTVQNILALMRDRKSLFDKFSITAPLAKITGA